MHTTRLLTLLGSCLCLGSVYAGGVESISPVPVTMFPYLPGISFYGLGGNGWTATGDVMAPLLGRPLNFTYVDPQIYYHNDPDDYTASAGVGQRWLDNRVGILGAYVFGDFNHANDGNSFWFVSPGIERLGRVLDFSLNGYIPVSSQRINNGVEFADQAGDFNDITFTGHTQIDELIQTFDSTGWGIDGQVGVRLPFRNSKIYLGGYYFSPKDNSKVGGGAIRAEVPINNYLSVALSEAYDSEYHNTLKGGLTLWFGGRHTGYDFNGDLTTRMVDPIQRNLVATAGGSHTAQPILSAVEDVGNAVELTNISFFVPENGQLLLSSASSGPVGEGTYEDPYRGMLQDNVNDGNLKNNRIFYINSGNYHAGYDATVNPNFIILNNDQLYGRTDQFKQPAGGGARPLISFNNNGFETPVGDTNDSITGLQLSGPGTGTGIFINHDLSLAPHFSAPDVVVSINNDSIVNFGDGIDILNGDSTGIHNPTAGNAFIFIDSSVVSNNQGVGGALVNLPGSVNGVSGGIAAVNYGNQLTVNVNISTISNNTLDKTDDLSAAGGIAIYNNTPTGTLILNVDESTISNNTNAPIGCLTCDNIFNTAGGIVGVIGLGNAPILANNSMIINVTRSQITNQTVGNSNATDIAGIGVLANAGNIQLNVRDSVISGNNMSSTHEVAGGIGIENLGNGEVLANVIGSTISNNTGICQNASGGVAALLNPFQFSMVLPILNINISSSLISGNSGTNSNGGVNRRSAAGGVAIIDVGQIGGGASSLTLNITNSNISGNTGQDADATGGVAVTNSNLASGAPLTTTVSVTGSSISNNTSIGDMTAGGGIALANENPSTPLTLQVNNSVISGNSVAGIMAHNTTTGGSPGPLTVMVDNSVITGSPVGASLIGPPSAVMNINRSSIYSNTIGLNANHSAITVTNPVYFNGVVNISNGGVITFPNNLTPSNGQTVICPQGTGICFIG